MVTVNGDWDWSRLNLILLVHVISHIVVIPPPNVLLGRDLPGWRNIHGVGSFANAVENSQLSANYVAAFSSSRSGVDVRRTSDFMWQRPPERCIKANSDGAMHPSSGKTTTGGVLRDDRGGNALVDALHELLDHQWKTRIRHIFREITGVADGPAAMSHGAPVAGLKFPCVPSELADLVE
ncbi:hypothetical protein V6N11_061943 [Hibiscus sabdariffa]|uniref:Uncharacterized protein n=1 Tax=Hibiscus sabdariffa TaxID=183260 RepID=A0ABR1Z7B0_9ROSI